MAGTFSVPAHTTFFEGYLDAVGRLYSDDKRLCAMTAATLPAEFLEGVNISGAQPVANMGTDFGREIWRFLGVASETRLTFYLVEYFEWYQQFSASCVCEKVTLHAADIPSNQFAYRLLLDDKHELLVFGYWKDKPAMPNTSLERTRER